MTQVSDIILSPNISGLNQRTEINGVFQAFNTAHKGSTRPATADAGTLWIDDAGDPIWTFNMYDGTDDIAIGTFNTTTNTFTPSGVAAADTFATDTVNKTATDTLVSGDNGKYITADATGAAFTLNLTAAATLGNGWRTIIHKTDSSTFAVTIDPNGAELINGVSTITLKNKDEAYIVYCNGSSFKAAYLGSINFAAITTENTLDSTNDLLAFEDNSAQATRKSNLDNILVNGLTAESTVDTANDTVTFYDNSAGAVRKTNIHNFLQGLLQGDIDVNGQKITTSANGNIILEPNGTGAVVVGGNTTQTTEIRFPEDADNGTNYVGFKALASLAGNQIWILPGADGAADTFLKTDGLGNLSFGSAGGAGVIVDTDSGTNVTSLTVTGIDDTYDNYLFLGSDLEASQNSVDLRFRLGDVGGIDTGGTDYAYAHASINDAGASVDSNSTGSSAIFLTVNNAIGSDTGQGANFALWMNRPQSGATYPFVYGDVCSYGSGISPNLEKIHVGGRRRSIISVDRAQISMDGGNISGRFTVIGFKNS